MRLKIKHIAVFFVLGWMSNSFAIELDTLAQENLSYDPEVIRQYLSGTASEAMPMMKLMMQVVAILFVGIFLWRISAVFSRRNVSKRQDMFSDSRFQKHWRKK